MLAWWEAMGIYKRLREGAADRPLWILHDGPPYANAPIHMGTVLNKVLKDLVVKSRSMMGFNSVYIPGWDCHGLPIEREVDKALGLDDASVDVRRAMDPVEKIRRCREHALKFVDIQRERVPTPRHLRRLGESVPDDGPGLRGRDRSRAGAAHRQGHGLQGAQAGPLVHALQDRPGPGRGRVRGAAEPVGLGEVPADLRAARCRGRAADVARHLDDDAVDAAGQPGHRRASGGGIRRAGRDRPRRHRRPRPSWSPPSWSTRSSAWPGFKMPIRVRHRSGPRAWSGSSITTPGSIARARWRPPTSWPWTRARAWSTSRRGMGKRTTTSVVAWGSASTTRWTTTAASCRRSSTSPASPCGRPTPGSSSTSASAARSWPRPPLTHTYPHCWRCKNPTLFRATQQWFMELDRHGLRARALDGDSRGRRVDPGLGRGAHLQHGRAAPRLGPLAPAGVGRADRGVLLRAVRRAPARGAHRSARGPDLRRGPRDRGVVPAQGARAAAGRGPAVRSARASASARRRTSSTSGSTRDAATRRCWRCGPSCAGPPSSTSRARISTGAGSTPRCWRPSARGARRPIRAVLTHGFVMDGQGRKMSKSLGNFIAPEDLLPKYGAEVLRLWVSAEDYTEDIRLSTEILDRLADAYRRIRNTFRFLLGNLYDFDPGRATASLTRGSRRWTAGSSTGWPGSSIAGHARLRGISVPHGLPRRAQLLRRGSLRAVPGHHQGPAVHVGARRSRAARGPDRLATTC